MTQTTLSRTRAPRRGTALLAARAALLLLCCQSAALAQSPPSGPAGGDLSGTYPNPTLASDRVRKTGDAMTGHLQVEMSSGAAAPTAFTLSGVGNPLQNRGISMVFKVPSGTVGGVGFSTPGGQVTNAWDSAGKTYLAFSAYNGSAVAEVFRLSGSGNVGVGTANPTSKLHIRSGTDSGTTLLHLDTGVHGGTAMAVYGTANNESGFDLSVFRGGAYSSRLGVNNTGHVYLQPSPTAWGRVGVGTTSPAYSLDVRGAAGGADGRINASGGLCIAGDCRVSWAQVTGGGSTQWTTSGANIYYNTGSVGVGTSAPNGKFEVSGGAFFLGDMGNSGWGNMVVRGRVLSANNNIHLSPPGGGTVYIDSNYREAGGATGPVHLSVSGTITGGAIEAKYQDVAEWVPSVQALTAGTVVVLDTGRSNHVLASSTAYDTRVAGVVSERPGLVLGEGGAGKLMVATTGRVRVRADATQAPIRVGDLLVTSGVEGVAMKSIPVDLGGVLLHRPGTIIGKALEPLEKGVGEILILLSLQ